MKPLPRHRFQTRPSNDIAAIVALESILFALMWSTSGMFGWWEVGLPTYGVYVGVLAVASVATSLVITNRLGLHTLDTSIGALFAVAPEFAVLAILRTDQKTAWFFSWWKFERIAHGPGYLIDALFLGFVDQHWMTAVGLVNPPFWTSMFDTLRVNHFSAIAWGITTGTCGLYLRRWCGGQKRR